MKAHVGALAWDNELTTLAQDQEELFIDKTNDSGISLLTGVGLGYGFNNIVAISIDFKRFKIADISSQSLGLSVFLQC